MPAGTGWQHRVGTRVRRGFISLEGWSGAAWLNDSGAESCLISALRRCCSWSSWQCLERVEASKGERRRLLDERGCPTARLCGDENLQTVKQRSERKQRFSGEVRSGLNPSQVRLGWVLGSSGAVCASERAGTSQRPRRERGDSRYLTTPGSFPSEPATDRET